MAKGSLLFSLCFALISNALAAYQIYHYDIPCDTKQLSVNYSVPQRPGFFATSHCFGEFDEYSTINEVSSTTAYTSYEPWNGDQLYSVVAYNITGYVNFLWVAKNSYGNSTSCGTFDHIVYQAEAEFDQFYVELPTRALQGKLAKGGKSGSVTWTKSGNNADTYELYWARTQEAPAGQNFATACSVRQWMNPFTDKQGSVKDNGDNTMTADVKDLDPETPFTIVVIAQRNNNSIAGVYDRTALNGKDNSGSALLPSVIMAMIVVLAMFW